MLETFHSGLMMCGSEGRGKRLGKQVCFWKKENKTKQEILLIQYHNDTDQTKHRPTLPALHLTTSKRRQDSTDLVFHRSAEAIHTYSVFLRPVVFIL